MALLEEKTVVGILSSKQSTSWLVKLSLIGNWGFCKKQVKSAKSKTPVRYLVMFARWPLKM